MKKILFLCIAALASAFTLNSCEDVPEPYKLPGSSSGNETPAITELTCAEALAKINEMADGSTTTESYTITGYITDVYTNISDGQQSFWMSDAKDGQKVIQAYFANLPEGVDAFQKDTKVKITGKLQRFINNNTGAMVPEVKNAKVEILKDEGGDQPDQPDLPEEPEGPVAPGITVSDRFIMLGAEGVTPGTETHRINLNAQGLESGKPVTEVKDGGCTITFSDGGNEANPPRFYDKTKGVRMRANNVVTFTADKTIASITITCDQDSKTSYVGNETRTWEVNSNTFTLTNTYAKNTGGTQLRIQAVKFTFAK